MRQELLQTKEESRLRIADLDLQLRSARETMQTEAVGAHALESYKKRAQQALKSANANAAALSEEVGRLKKLSEEESSRCAEAESANQQLQEELKSLRAEVETLQYVILILYLLICESRL